MHDRRHTARRARRLPFPVGLLALALAISATAQQPIALPEAPPARLPASPCANGCGRPESIPTVYLHSGELHVEVVDLAIPGRGLDFVWQRSYRSRIGRDTPQGHGWDHSYDVRIAAEGADVRVYDGNGRSDVYRRRPNGSYVAEQFHREGRFDASGAFTLTFADLGTWVFHALDGSPRSGRIRTIADRHGNALQCHYDGAGLLSRIVDTLGREIRLQYRPDGRLLSITDFIGREVRYDYHAAGSPGGGEGDLASVRSPVVVGTPNGNDFPLGKTTTYTYSKGQPHPDLDHNLLSITDPKGQTWLRNTYASAGRDDLLFDRVIRQQRGDPGDVIDVTYHALHDDGPRGGDGDATLLAIVNDRVGNVREYRYDLRGRCVSRRDFTGRADPDRPTTRRTNRPRQPLRSGSPPFYETKWSYNADSLVTELLSPDGGRTVFVYELELDPTAEWRARGHLRERRVYPGPLGPAGDGSVLTELFEYQTGLGSCCGGSFVTKHTDARGNVTTHAYDQRGNRLQTVHRLPSIVEDFDYNFEGQLVTHVWPDNGSGHRQVDTYTYYPAGTPQAGYLQSQVLDATGLALTTTWVYDPAGNAVAVTDPRGNTTMMIVNALDQVVRTISAPVATLGSVASYEVDTWYDANDNVVRVDVQNVDDQGRIAANAWLTTTRDYDVLDCKIRESREIDVGRSAVTEYGYDANRNPTLVRHGEAVSGAQPADVVARVYDERDLLYLETRGAGGATPSTTRYDYSGDARLTVVRRGLEGVARVWTSVFDGWGREVMTIDPMGNTASRTFDPNGNLLRERIDGELCDVPGSAANVRLYEATFGYDAMDRLTRADEQHFDPRTQAPIGDGIATTLFTWTDRSELAARTDDNGHAVRVSYDRANRRAGWIDAIGNSVAASFDGNDNLVALVETDVTPSGGRQIFRSTRAFDALDRPEDQADPLGHRMRCGYDSRGNLTRIVDALGNVTQYGHDGLDRLRTNTRILTATGTGAGRAIGAIVRAFDWDDSLRLVRQIDDNEYATGYVYDDLGRTTAVHYADGTARQLVYDLFGSVVSATDPNGTVVMSSYDDLGRLVGRAVQPAAGVAADTTFEIWKHDGLSRLVHAEDDDSLVTCAWDSLSNPIEETQNGKRFVSVFDGVGNEVSRTYPGGKVVRYRYDELNRIQGIDNAGPAATYGWIGQRRLASRDTGGGIAMTIYGYDGARRLVALDHVRGPAELDRRTFVWDAMSNKVQAAQVGRGAPAVMHDYAYDSSYRMLRSVLRDGAGALLADVRYTLDGVGNRMVVSGGACAGTYVMDPTTPEPADRQMSQYTTSPCIGAISYDRNGSEVLRAGAVSLLRDYRDRIAEHRGTTTARYEYDALGRRTAVHDGRGGTTRYYYAGRDVVEERDASDRVIAEYVRGVGGEIVEMVRFGQRFFFFADDLGSTRAVTDAAGNLVERYEYGDFGVPSFFDARGPIGGTAIGNAFLFTGQHYDEESGLYDYKARHMDPRNGRFTSRDPIGVWGDPNNLGNGLAYAGNNPQTLVDPLGTYAGRRACGGPWPGPKTVYFDRIDCGLATQIPDALCMAMRGAGRAERAARNWLTFEMTGYPSSWGSWLVGVPFDEYFAGPDGDITAPQVLRIWVNLATVWRPFRDGLEFRIECDQYWFGSIPSGACAGANALYYGEEEIHLCPNWWTGSARRRASVILHELTHKEFGAPDTFYYRDFDLSNNAIADGRVRVPGVGLLEVNLFETPALMWNADTYEELYHKWYVQ